MKRRRARKSLQKTGERARVLATGRRLRTIIKIKRAQIARLIAELDKAYVLLASGSRRRV
jgi:hypothetical protein